MKQNDDLIYELIFSKQEKFKVIVTEYIDDIYKYDKFIKKIKKVLDKSNVSIIEEKIDVTSNKVIWNLKVKK